MGRILFQLEISLEEGSEFLLGDGAERIFDSLFEDGFLLSALHIQVIEICISIDEARSSPGKSHGFRLGSVRNEDIRMCIHHRSDWTRREGVLTFYGAGYCRNSYGRGCKYISNPFHKSNLFIVFHKSPQSVSCWRAGGRYSHLFQEQECSHHPW